MRKNVLIENLLFIFFLITLIGCSTSKPTGPRIENNHTKYVSRIYIPASEAPNAYQKDHEEYDPSPFAKPQFTSGREEISDNSDGSYGGLQYGLVTISDDDIGDIEPTALALRIGTFIGENIAIEGRYGIGIAGETIHYQGMEIEMEIDSMFGIYGVFHTDSKSDFSLYGIIGYTDAEIKASASGKSVSDDEKGVSYGLGVKLYSLIIEYMNYFDETDTVATAVSLGFVYEF